MSPGTVFVVLLCGTVVALIAAVLMGLKGRPRVHVPLVLVTLALLVLTIWRALELGERYDLEGAGAIYPVHLFVARLTSVALVLPVGAGVAALLDRSRETLHRRLAWVALALIAATTITGVLLMWRAQPLP